MEYNVVDKVHGIYMCGALRSYNKIDMYLLTYLLNARSRVLLKKLTSSQLVNKLDRGHSVVYYEICVIYYAPSIHKIHQTR